MNDLCQPLLAFRAPSTKVDELEEYKNSGKLRQPLVALWPFPLCKKVSKIEEYNNSGIILKPLMVFAGLFGSLYKS
jgi:hypothetical protein